MELWLDIAAIAGLVLLIARMIWKNPVAFFPIGSILLVQIWESISVAYLETGTYTPELLLETHRTGATFRFVFAIALFVLAYWATFRALLNRNWKSRLNAQSAKLNSATRLALPMILAALAATLLLAVFVPREAVDLRSRYLHDHPNFLRDELLAYLPTVTLILGLGCGLARTARARILGYTTMLLILTVLYLFGNKFSEITESFFLFCIPLVACIHFYPMDRKVFGMSLRRQMLFAGCAVLALVTMGVLRQINQAQLASSDTQGEEYLMQRVFIAQGGIYWFTDNQIVHGASQPRLAEFLQFVRDENYSKNSSLMYLMSLAIGYDLTWKIFTINNSLFTGAFPSIFFIIGGRYGPFFLCPLVGVIVGAITAYSLRKMLQGQLLLAVLAFSIFAPVQGFASSAEFTGFLSWGFATKLFLLLTAEAYLFSRAMIVGGQPEEAM